MLTDAQGNIDYDLALTAVVEAGYIHTQDLRVEWGIFGIRGMRRGKIHLNMIYSDFILPGQSLRVDAIEPSPEGLSRLLISQKGAPDQIVFEKHIHSLWDIAYPEGVSADLPGITNRIGMDRKPFVESLRELGTKPRAVFWSNEVELVRSQMLALRAGVVPLEDKTQCFWVSAPPPGAPLGVGFVYYVNGQLDDPQTWLYRGAVASRTSLEGQTGMVFGFTGDSWVFVETVPPGWGDNLWSTTPGLGYPDIGKFARLYDSNRLV